MHTCRTLYELGLPIFLGANYPSKGGAMSRLHSRFIATYPSRCSHIRRWASTYEQARISRPGLCGTLDVVANILVDAPNLLSLELAFTKCPPAEEDLQSILSLKSLEQLVLKGPEKYIGTLWTMLDGVSAPLEHINIQCTNLAFSRFVSPNGVDPLHHISHFSRTLRILHVGWLEADLDQSSGLYFPVVESLSWISTHFVTVEALTSTFPNLDSLSVYCLKRPVTQPELVSLRQRNQQTQQLRHLNLRSFAGDVASLWTLCLTSPVSIVVPVLWWPNTPWTYPVIAHHASQILADTQPDEVHLIVHQLEILTLPFLPLGIANVKRWALELRFQQDVLYDTITYLASFCHY